MTVDEEQLRVLSVVHYVFGGITAFLSCFPLIYILLGIGFVTGAFKAPANGPGPTPPVEFGWLFVVIGALGLLLSWAVAISLIFAGQFLRLHKGYVFCMVVAAIQCLSVPFGTILGILTIVVLMRPTVQAMFGRGPQKQPMPGQDFA
jgi:hypothetical protein